MEIFLSLEVSGGFLCMDGISGMVTTAGKCQGIILYMEVVDRDTDEAIVHVLEIDSTGKVRSTGDRWIALRKFYHNGNEIIRCIRCIEEDLEWDNGLPVLYPTPEEEDNHLHHED